MTMILDFLKNDKNQPHQVLPNLELNSGSCQIMKNSLGNYNYVYVYVSNKNGKLVKRVAKKSESNGQTDLRLQE